MPQTVVLIVPIGPIRGGQKVNHYQETSLNRIKNRQRRYIFHQF